MQDPRITHMEIYGVEDEPDWMEESIAAYVNKKQVYSNYGSGDGGTSLPNEKTLAAKYWFGTKRGRALYEAYLEIHQPLMTNYHESRYGSTNGWQYRVYNPESLDQFYYWRFYNRTTEFYKEALDWVVGMGLIKVNDYHASSPSGHWRRTVTIGGVKVQASGNPCEAPEPDYEPDYEPDWY